MNFSELGLGPEVLRGVEEAGHTTPTPIQEQAIPYVLMGRDVLGCAQTGTGKTASFVLPMLDIVATGRARARMPRCLILEPTRELAAQVADDFEVYGKYHKLGMALLIGGVSFSEQDQRLDRGVDVLIATPGRLLDHFERGRVLLSDVKILVIDEADRMLDMGFIPDVERIVSLMPRIRQTLMFSATMMPEIRGLADRFLLNPKQIVVDPPATPAELVQQHMVMVDAMDKRRALRALLHREKVSNALVFCNRKRDIGVLTRSLKRHGFAADALHGDMAQAHRMETLDRFRAGEIPILVCSDVAARGLDIEFMSHVFTFDVPHNPEDYVHRIGRTGRAGREGRSFVIATPEDTTALDRIVKLIGRPIERIKLDGFGDAGPRRQDRTKADQPQRRRSASGRQKRRKKAADSDTPSSRVSRPRRRRTGGTKQTGKGRRQGREAETAPPERTVVGLGDHVPAFLQRPVSHPEDGR
ncbi:MAG: DEAD/DEAH box helicase [Kiloniellales bacterium]